MSRALINGVAAFENGINWIDSTVTGMAEELAIFKPNLL